MPGGPSEVIITRGGIEQLRTQSYDAELTYRIYLNGWIGVGNMETGRENYVGVRVASKCQSACFVVVTS